MYYINNILLMYYIILYQWIIFIQGHLESLEAELDEDDPLKIQPNGEDFLANYRITENIVKNITSNKHNNNNIV